MALNLLVGKTVLRQISAQVILVVIFVLCFSCTQVCGTCVPDNEADNCSLEANVTCSPKSCIEEVAESKPELEIIADCEDIDNNCTTICPENCARQLCDNSTGDCSVGCNAGYLGIRCEEVCGKGYYGDECKKECPTKCATRDCHHESGNCLQGCKEDFWGSDCTLIGEFKDNPEPIQQKFYSHLSAESKSILLYILMRRYEDTIERAQMEISRGIQQKNELRALLG